MSLGYFFVYGTLKDGFWNHYTLGKSRKVGRALTKTRFVMTTCGFPYMIPEDRVPESTEKPCRRVYGEVYDVDDIGVLKDLDALEGVAYGHYERVSIPVEVEGETLEAFAYVPLNERVVEYPICETAGEGEEEGYVFT